jgi:pimeloyl-ACP methyl ester carboxylesterase
VKTQIIPDAGHNIHLEQPQAFADAITDFLG